VIALSPCMEQWFRAALLWGASTGRELSRGTGLSTKKGVEMHARVPDVTSLPGSHVPHPVTVPG